MDASRNPRWTVLVLTSMWRHLSSGVVIPVPLWVDDHPAQAHQPAPDNAVPSHAETRRDGSIRNRENLVVSNREVRQLFDTIKQLGDIVKRKNAKLDSLSVELENACKEEAEVKTELQTVRHKLDRQPQSTEKENIHRGPVPKQLKVCANFCSSTVAIGVSF